MSIKDKKVFFLLSFGHCGIDWTHALLTSHEKILILPAFSFYRGWKNTTSVNNYQLCVDSVLCEWKRYLDYDYSDKEGGRFFCSNNDNELFYTRFKSNLTSFGLRRKSVFYALHEAYAYVKNIDINYIEVIVEHEHVCFDVDCIFKDFLNPNILFLLRDPRAAIAGYYRGIERKCIERSDCYHHLISKSWAEWRKATSLFYRHSSYKDSNIHIVKYENLVHDFTISIKNITSILGIKYRKILTIPTNADGTPWRTDTCYISNSDPDVNRDIFFTKDRIKERWMSVLTKKDIISIEVVFSKIMKDFGYKKMYRMSLANQFTGYLYAIYPHRGKDRFSFYKADQNERQSIIIRSENIILSCIVKYSPFYVLTFFQYIFSINDNIRIILGNIPEKYN